MQEVSETQEGFLTLMDKCRGWKASDKVYHPLNRRDLATFMDADIALARIKDIADNSSSEQNRSFVKELLVAVEDGEWGEGRE